MRDINRVSLTLSLVAEKDFSGAELARSVINQIHKSPEISPIHLRSFLEDFGSGFIEAASAIIGEADTLIMLELMIDSLQRPRRQTDSLPQ